MMNALKHTPPPPDFEQVGPSPMASLPGKFLLSFFFLLSLAGAKLDLDGSDREAILAVQRDVDYSAPGSPCALVGIHCERRRRDSENGSLIVLRVTRIVLGAQQLTGSLSPEIGRLSELRELSLPNNSIVDRIPPQIADLKKLEILDLRKNQFSGEIPLAFSSLIRLRILDLSSNRLSGNLNFLKHFPNLEKLSLADNLFVGRVPASLRSFRNLRSFDFSGNSLLEGPLVGNLRTKQSPSSSSSSPAAQNRYILLEKSNTSANGTAAATRNSSNSAMAPQSSALAPGPSTGVPKKKKKKNKKKKIGGWILGFGAGALAGCLSGLVCSVLFKLLLVLIRGQGKEPGPSIYSPQIKKGDLAFLEKEDGLASMQIIGRGGCGEVYKAELPGSNGKQIAIKKIIQAQKDSPELTEEDSKLLNKKMRQIRSEINTVSKIRHRNLLPLLAHVSRPDCHYLVYEFMKNGSLQDVMTEVEEGRRDLDWPGRLRIAIGVAAGLEYLHTSQSPRIIHRDLKPANVLLDDDMEARIADFGLAKAIPDANTHVTSSNVAGTVGYIAPEYHQTFKFTDKCDIYSFGVMLGVLVMGKLPSDDFFQHTAEMGLVKWLRNVMMTEDPSRAIDSKLMGNGHEEQMLLVLKIACFCTLDDPKQRPNSKDVRCMLAQIKQ